MEQKSCLIIITIIIIWAISIGDLRLRLNHLIIVGTIAVAVEWSESYSEPKLELSTSFSSKVIGKKLFSDIDRSIDNGESNRFE